MYDNAKAKLLGNKVLLGWLLVLVLFGTFVGIMYSSGYRLKNNLTIGKIGVLRLNIEIPDTEIFIDQSKKIVTTKENEVVEIKFSPRRHSVIVSNDDYYPWKKDFIMESGGELEYSPVFVYKNPSGQIITETDPEYWTLRSRIIRDLPPSKENPLVSQNGLVKIYLDDNSIVAERGSTTTKVIQPDSIVRNLSFYKDRDDVVIFSTLNGVFTIETENTGGQNFMPVYKGQKPSFINSEDNFIYVLDNELLMQVLI